MKNTIKQLLRGNILLIEAYNNTECPFCIGNEEDSSYWYENTLIKENNRLFKEGLIKTYPLNFTIQSLGKYGIVKVIQNKPYLKIKDKSKSNVEKLINHINTLGYFVSQYKVLFNGKETKPENYIDYKESGDVINNLNNINELWFIIEPKFDDTTNNNIVFLYHLTEKININKIKTNGLIPKSKSKKSYHPDRIYVVDDIKKLKDVLTHFTSEDKNINDFVILKIDYKLAGSPRLHNDPNYLNMGYYLIDNIRPKSIVDVINANEI